MDPMSKVRPGLESLRRTVHGGKGWMHSDVEDYSHNLNPLGPPPDLEGIIAEAAAGVDHYPDDGCTELKAALAERFGVGTGNVIVGAGSSDLIRLFPTVFISPGDVVLIPRPSFAEYTAQCRIMGARVEDLLLIEGEEFRIDEGRLFKRMNHSTKAFYLCNPNNPTGRVEGRETVRGIVEECDDREVLVFLDETLLELAPNARQRSCVDLVRKHDNLFVIGSLTKSFAIPGIRVGYGFGGERMIDCLERARLSWNVGHIEQCVSTALIRHGYGHIERAAEMLEREGWWMAKELMKVGFPVERAPDAYFFFTSLKGTGIDVQEFQRSMFQRGFMVRDCSSFGRPFENHIRFCVKDRDRNAAFVWAVHDTLLNLGR